MVWEYILEAFGRAVAADARTQGAARGPAAPNTAAGAAPPTMGDPVSGPAQLLTSFWMNYGPSIIAGGAQLLRQTAQTAQGAAAPPVSTRGVPAATATASAQDSPAAVAERRRQLEAELARLSDSSTSTPGSVTSIPVQIGSSSYLPTSPGSDTDLRSRVAQYEEIEVPSDIEGYDVGPTPTKTTSVPESRPTRPAGRKSSSWFPWGAPAAGAAGPGSPSSSNEGDDKSKKD